MARGSLITTITNRGRRALGALLGRVETRSAGPTSWDLMKWGGASGDIGLPVSPYAAENHAAVSACVQAIAESVAMCPVRVLRRGEGGTRLEAPEHPIARLFGEDGPNAWQSGAEVLEQMTAHALLRGWAPAEIVRDGRGQPVRLEPYHPDWVSLVEITGGDGVRYRFDVSPPRGGTRRVLFDDMLVLRDRTDDGITPRPRLARAREAALLALQTQRYASSTFRNGATLSGILTHPEQIGEEARGALRDSFAQTYAGADKAGSVAVLEEGLRWQSISNSPADAEMTEALRLSTEDVCRIFRVPPPIVGQLEGGNYSSLSEVGRWFYVQTVAPWLHKWELAIARAMLSAAGRRLYEVELDADETLRGDLLTRMQAYRIGREIGVYNANDLRRWERLNPRTDPDAEIYLSPMNMQPGQERRPIADRTPGGTEPEPAP